MIQVFIDTNVLLDYLSGREPFCQESARLLESVQQGTIKGFVSSLSFSNLYYILRKFHSHQHVISALDEISDTISIIKVDGKVIKKALKSRFTDFEDAIQYQAALSKKGINTVITRNIKDYRHARIPVMTPETFLRTLDYSA